MVMWTPFQKVKHASNILPLKGGIYVKATLHKGLLLRL